jgi:hypothetical protein
MVEDGIMWFASIMEQLSQKAMNFALIAVEESQNLTRPRYCLFLPLFTS